ncbi:BTAD domain-containing putative transcriptional regulator [Nonomuraea jabiensis]|uniref:AfsR/SARP family transcriptional regulator n=1 Tax=Nonomuraea jabiensis TaxID=882448 RepID=UPI003D75DACA
MPSLPGLDVFVLGPVTVRAGDATIVVDRLLERALLTRLALAGGSPVPDARLAADLWGEAELARPTERLRVLVSRLRATLPPALPTDPAGPAPPADPADPARPAGAASPADPGVLGDPVGPPDPAVPADPVGPAFPAGPTVPARPALPVGPDLPTGPDVPLVPTGPGVPTGPSSVPTGPSSVPIVPTGPGQGRVRAGRSRQASLLVRTPGGYALDAHAADLVTARAAAERAHAAARSGDHAGARSSAAQALGLWRGSALADLRAIPYAELEGERLEAWRLDLMVQRLTADLALGAAAEVSAELERLADEHQLHERLSCLLALALYRTGRQADALDRLSRLRRRLADALGVDPVPETAALELQILRQDPSLQLTDATPTEGGTAIRPDPSPLPAQSPAPDPSSLPAPSPRPEPFPLSAASPAPDPSSLPAPSPRPEPFPLSAASPAPELSPLSAQSPEPEPSPCSGQSPGPEPSPLPAASPGPDPSSLPAQSPEPQPFPFPVESVAPDQARSRVRLPGPATSFVGRDGELAALVRRLARPGLVTLTGGPGSGKSRLAIEAAKAVAQAPAAEPRAVTLVELAPLHREGAVRAAVTAAVGLESESDDPLPELAARLDGGLLVLDNAEHLVDQVAELVIGLLGRTDGLAVLVTSQLPLLAAGEELNRVGPLPAHAAATLFTQRCAPDQADADPAAVAAICAAVDRLPLGIELAAGLTRTLTVAQLAARVEDRLRLLAGGGRNAGGRHTSLRAALDWSHDLLAERERLVLRRVSVFSGGFDLEAAEQVVPDVAAGPGTVGPGTVAPGTVAPGRTGVGMGGHGTGGAAGEGMAVGDVAPALAELADRSLVTVETAGGGRRFGLLETVRDYARAKLLAAGEMEGALAAHLGWCVAFVRRLGAPTDFLAAEEVSAVFAEWPNLLDALEHAPGTERAADGLRLALELHTPWLIRGWYGEAERHFSALADAPGSTPTEQATALSDHAFVSTMVGKFDAAAELLTRAAALAEVASDDMVTMNVLYYRGIVEIERGRLREALPPLLQGLELAESVSHTQRVSAFADALGTLHLYSGDAEQALQRYVTANAFDLETGDEHGLARGLSNQAQALLGMGHLKEALACATESDHYAARLDDRQILPLNELIRGAVAMAEQDLARAEHHMRTAVGYAVTDGSGAGMAHIDLADVLIRRGVLDEAAALLDEVYAESAEHSTPWLAARAVSAALALARRDRRRAGELVEATAAAYAASGFGWPRYAARLEEVRTALATP